MIQLRGHLRPLRLLNFATYLAAHPALPRADGTVPQRMPFLHCIIVTFCTGSSPPCMLYRCRYSRVCFSLAGCAPMGSCVGGGYPPAGEGQKALLLSPAAWHHLSLTSLSLTSSRNSLGRSKPKTPIKFGSRPPILAFCFLSLTLLQPTNELPADPHPLFQNYVINGDAMYCAFFVQCIIVTSCAGTAPVTPQLPMADCFMLAVRDIQTFRRRGRWSGA